MFRRDREIATYFFIKDRPMAAANGEDSVPDTWDDTTGGTGDSGPALNAAFALKLNVNAPVFTPGQNVFAPAFVPCQPKSETPDTASSAENTGMSTEYVTDFI